MTTSITGGRKRPLQKAAVRSSGWTRERRKRFLDTLAETCNVRMSVEAAGMKVPGAYMLRRRDPAFAALWAEALAMGYERLEAALLSRALEGVNDIAIGDEPDEGVEAGGARRMSPQDVQLALVLLGRHRATLEGREASGGRRGHANPDETDAALRRQLDALARKRKADA